MTKTEAIDIIHSKRASNSFTMGMTLEEYIDFFRRNYARIFKKILPADPIAIAEEILEKDSE